MACKCFDIKKFTVELYYPTVSLSKNFFGVWCKNALVFRRSEKGFAFAIVIFGIGAGVEYMSMYNKNIY